MHRDRLLGADARGDLPRPAHDRRDADAALEHRVLAVVQRRVGADAPRRAVVGAEDDQRVFAQPEFVEGRQDPADPLVEPVHHGFVKAVGLVLLEEFLRGGQGRVRRVEGHLQEEGFARIALPELADGFVGEQRGRIPFLRDRLVVTPPVRPPARVEVLEVIQFGPHEAIEMLEAVAQRPGVGAEVPLADQRGRVAGLLQGGGERRRPLGDALLARAHHVDHAETPRHHPGEKRGAGRTADRVAVEALELDALLRQLRQGRRRHPRVMVAHAVPAQVVGDEQQHVDRAGRLLGLGRNQAEQQEEERTHRERGHLPPGGPPAGGPPLPPPGGPFLAPLPPLPSPPGPPEDCVASHWSRSPRPAVPSGPLKPPTT